MVGSDRSKEAVGMMALHEALRNVCVNSDWTYSVFWTIRPRPRSRGGSGCKVGDDNGSLMLMWEDGFCRPRVAECLEEIDGEDPVRKAFSKMSIQLYNYGEGLMGKVASDKCHKWVFKEPSECEPNISNYWQSSFDALPPEWTDQFASGIQTIAVIQAGHGLLQLGSCKIIPEDLHFVLRMRHTFESLGYQSGFYLSQLFSASRNTCSSSTPRQTSSNRPPPIFNWSQRPLPAATINLSNTPGIGMPTKDDTHHFLLPHQSDSQMEDMIGDHESDIKWPNGLSFFNALTSRADDPKLLFGADSLGDMGEMAASSTQKRNNPPLNPFLASKNTNSPVSICSNVDDSKAAMSEASNLQTHGNANDNASAGNDYLSLESHSNNIRKMGSSKFKRSFTLPARIEQSQHHNNNSVEAGIYSDIMDTFIE